MDAGIVRLYGASHPDEDAGNIVMRSYGLQPETASRDRLLSLHKVDYGSVLISYPGRRMRPTACLG